MLWFKVQCGVLRVVAGKEARLAEASAGDRLRLLWMFRNFSSLPIQVLSPRQRALVERLYAESVPARHTLEFSDAGRVIGTIERPAGSPERFGGAPKKPSMGEKKVSREVALPRASGMAQDWVPQTPIMAGARGASTSVLSGATAQLRALAGTISAASHKTGKVLSFPARTCATALPVRSKLGNWRRSVSPLLHKNLESHAVAEFVLRRRMGVGLLIALLSVLAFALTRDSSRPTAPGRPEAPSAPGSVSRTLPRETIGVQPPSPSELPNNGGEPAAESSMGATAKQIARDMADGRAGIAHIEESAARGSGVPKSAIPMPGVQSANNETLAAQAQSQPVSGTVSAISQPREQVVAAMRPAMTAEEPAAARVRLQQGPRAGIIFPSYPAAAWKNGKRGRVTLRAQVAPAGAVSEVEVLSGDPALAEAARRALQRWHYEEQNAPADVVVRFDFINPEAISIEFEP